MVIGNELYGWQELTGEGWGLITAGTIDLPDVMRVLVTRSQEVAEYMRPLAETHQHATQHPVRLARFECIETVEDLPTHTGKGT
jgi:hypothetical protein